MARKTEKGGKFIAFYLRLVGMAREHILAGDFKAWKESMVPKLTRRL